MSAYSLRTQSDFVLLAPVNESQELQERRVELQGLLGGRIITPIHFTCQRFIFNDPGRMPEFLAGLQALATQFQPFPVVGDTLVSLYSEFRKGRVLKWRIDPGQKLPLFSEAVAKLLKEKGGKSLYPQGWMSTLISALDGIERMEPSGVDLDLIPIPRPLFTAEQILVARFTEQGNYHILHTYPLRGDGL